MPIHCHNCQGTLSKQEAIARIPASKLAAYFPPPCNRNAIPIEFVVEMLNVEGIPCDHCQAKGEWWCDVPGDAGGNDATSVNKIG